MQKHFNPQKKLFPKKDHLSQLKEEHRWSEFARGL
jgi:hypothetical protein